MSGILLDLILAALVVGYGVAGYRTGFVVTAASLAGFVLGGLAGLALLPRLVSAAGADDLPALTRAILLVGGTIILAILAQTLFGILGSRLGRYIRGRRTGRQADGIAGSLVAALVTIAMAWGVSTAVRPLLPTSWSRTVASSHVLGAVDSVMPSTVAAALADIRARGEAEVFPRVFGGLAEEPIVPVTPPDPNVKHTPGLDAAQASIVKIVSDAPQCDRREKGSGWVVAPGKVVTNAHVVAGSSAVTVSSGGTGRRRAATVVLFDPSLDLAVLSVPGLPVPALPVAKDLGRGAPAVVAGFPLGGPYALGSARVRGILPAVGNDIYDATKVERSVYSLYSTIRPGNSGGPVLDPQGRVVGTVFARSLDDAHTGYALTMAQSAGTIAQGVAATQPTGTGACTKD